MAIKAHKDGVMLFVKLTPKASKNTLVKLEENSDGHTRLKVTVTAIPEKGKANNALVKLLSKKLGLPKTSIELIAGDQSRLKTILFKGETAALEKILSERVAALGQT